MLNSAWLSAEYFYEGDQLIEFKGYSPGGDHQLYLSAVMTRNGKMPDQYAMKATEILWPGGMVYSPPQPAYTFSKIEKGPSTKYAYDNHPNPFFKLGIDLDGRLSVKSFSVNNIVREEIPDTGQPYVLNYAYEYLPNGYPSKVTMTGAPGSGLFPKIYKFEY